jgi:hypothetical protein
MQNSKREMLPNTAYIRPPIKNVGAMVVGLAARPAGSQAVCGLELVPAK